MNPETQKIYNDATLTAQNAAKLIGGSYTPTAGLKVNRTMDASRLGEPSLKLSQPKANTQSAGLLASVDAINLQAQNNVDPLVDKTAISQAQNTNDVLKQSIWEKLGITKGKTKLTDEAYRTEGVDTAKKELNDINAQINAKSLGYRRQIEKIRENQGGLFGGAVEQEVSRIERQASSELADLSIIQQAKNDNYTTAREIADRKVAAEVEQDQNELEALKFFYSDNKDTLSKKEDQQFQLLIDERTRLLTEKTAEKKAINDRALNALQNGAPSSVVQQALSKETEAEALTILGPYIDSLDRQLKIANIENVRSQISERNSTSGSGKKLTQAQQVALSYANRVSDSNAVIGEIGDKFAGAGSYFGRVALNAMKSEDRQKFEQAQRNFINAVLRRESGAAIAPSEFDSARQQYFPQPGDTKGVLEQKALNRQRTLENLLAEGGQDITSTIDKKEDPLGLGFTNPLGI
jgi:hypothetical protein